MVQASWKSMQVRAIFCRTGWCLRPSHTQARLFAVRRRRRAASSLDPWTAVTDSATGQIYYWNTQTNETTQLGAPKPAFEPASAAQASTPAPATPESAEAVAQTQASSQGFFDDPASYDSGDNSWWQKCKAHHLSAGEMYCLRKKGYVPNQFVMGNIAQSIGTLSKAGLMSTFQSFAGGSNDGFRDEVQSARQSAYDRMHAEGVLRGGDAIVGTRLDFVRKAKHLEIVMRGTTVDAKKSDAYKRADGQPFSMGCSGNGLYCLLDSGFQPRKFVFGNEAYSRGLKGWLTSAVGTSVMAGHVPAISDVFHAARFGALQRLQEAAFNDGSNFVSGVCMKAFNYSFVQEVSFMGTACFHPNLPVPQTASEVATSALSEAELWNIVDLGYTPLGVVTRTCVFNVGMVGSWTSSFTSLTGGEVDRYTALVQNARRHTMSTLRDDALELSPNAEIMGLDIEMVEVMPGLLEFSAFGTAVEQTEAITNSSEMLPPQAFEVPRPTYTRSHRFSNDLGGLERTVPMRLGGGSSRSSTEGDGEKSETTPSEGDDSADGGGNGETGWGDSDSGGADVDFDIDWD